MNVQEIFESDYKTEQAQAIVPTRINWLENTRLITMIAENIEPKFKYSEQDKKIFKLLLLYFTGNSRFLEYYKEIYGKEGSLSKGLFIVGGVGTGKSLIFKIFKEYTRKTLHVNSFKYYNVNEIIDNVNISGKEYLRQFSDNLIDRNQANPYTIYIDDIGASNEDINHFGTKTNVIEELFSLRYNVFLKYRKLTHMSSNLYPKDLSAKYDVRIVDRIIEMFNVIEMNGISKRK
jgi:DNA replication protein DnaC